MYLIVLDYVVSVILFQQAQADGAKPIYYVSKTLVDTKTCYSQVEHTTLALRVAAKKLRLYF